MDKPKDKGKEKTPAIETFPSDETPTPTKILRMADLDLFQDYQDIKENPFDVHFRKAAEAVKRGADSLSASVNASEISESDSLNTPQIFVSDTPSTETIVNTIPSIKTRPVILRSNSTNRVSNKPTASVQPSTKTFKPIAPHPPLFTAPSNSNDNAMLLLKFPGGETVKLSNLPFVKCDSGSSSSSSGAAPSTTVSQETKLRLKNVKNLVKSASQSSPPSSSTSSAGAGASAEESLDAVKDDLKERNRMSAQRSRSKKRVYMETLMTASDKRKKENDALVTENKRLSSENMMLRRMLSEHLDCNVTRKKGSREAIASELSFNKLQPNVRTHNMETQTSGVYDDKYPQSYQYQGPPSPPQTYPEDLRVDTRIKDSEQSVVSPQQSEAAPTVTLPPPSPVKVKTKERNGPPARRLKDKLHILKQKLVEDETTLSNIKSGKI